MAHTQISATHIVLIGEAGDAQLASVRRRLDERGALVSHWDSGAWPGPGALASLRLGTEGCRARFGGVALDDVDAVYVRNMGLDPLYERFAEDLETRPFSMLNQLREFRGLIMSVLLALEDQGAYIVNPPNRMGLHQLKPHQIARFQAAGLPVPASLASGEVEEVLAFCRDHAEVIYKPIAGGGYARLLGEHDREPGRLQLLANAPVLFQERIHGDNVRLFVLDGEVLAAGRIVSDELDYRISGHAVERIEPEEAWVEVARRACALFGLHFSGVDLIVQPDGHFVILEANPSPMFATFDALSGSSVGLKLADHLIDHVR